MNKPIKQTIDGKMVSVYASGTTDAPIVFSNDVMDTARAVLSCCRKRNCPDFHLVSITKLNWDAELSPWPHEPVVDKRDDFRGLAGQYLSVLEREIVPFAESVVRGSGRRILSGYSMGGLFSLYAAYESSLFDAFASVSGSVWYPDFAEYVQNHGFSRMPQAIYLSLGDKESKTQNVYLARTEETMRFLEQEYQKRGVATVFELNHGGHFDHPNGRVAKALAWILGELEKRPSASIDHS